MLESTLGAVYSSFRAVLDVADHFSRVKATFTDILSSITVFRYTNTRTFQKELEIVLFTLGSACNFYA